MIIDGMPWRKKMLLGTSGLKREALATAIDFIERKFGAMFSDARSLPLGRPDLFEPLALAHLLQKNGVIKKFAPTSHLSDEPQTKSWYAICGDPAGHQTGGTTWENDEDALNATLAEALERYIWMTQDDYFLKPFRGTIAQVKKRGPFVAPSDIAGYSADQREAMPERVLRPDATYLWIQGISLITGDHVYLPEQIVSGIRQRHSYQEPLIRQKTTIGLATWPTQSGARLAGALEVIEREAYMIMWLNQMTLPRIAYARLCAENATLARAIATCERYRLKTHVIQLPTDAPTHVVAVVIEDMSGSAPRFTVGMKAHRRLSFSIQKAMTEALRSRNGYRRYVKAGNVWDTSTPEKKIGHRERLYYWGIPENAKHLEFLIQGEEIEVTPKPWDADSETDHLERIKKWCKEKGFECIAVPLTKSAKNPTRLHIEMVVIPELQPTYLMEWLQAFGKTRWQDVPKSLGYTPLVKPFADRPHPFS